VQKLDDRQRNSSSERVTYYSVCNAAAIAMFVSRYENM
jgi:hypothetical protein